MPKITNFVFCEPGQFEESSRQIKFIEGVATSHSLFGFAILFSINSYSDQETHTGYVTVKDPQNVELIRTEDFTIGKTESPLEGSINGFTMVMEFWDVEFKGRGLYTVELFFDNKLLNEFSLPVLLKKEGDQDE